MRGVGRGEEWGGGEDLLNEESKCEEWGGERNEEYTDCPCCVISNYLL